MSATVAPLYQSLMPTGGTEADVPALLAAWRAGDRDARDALVTVFYADLRQSAAGMLRGEAGVSLAPSDLVHESLIKLVALDRIAWQDRAHFKALAARMMRHALIDHVRAKRRGKRAHHKVELVTSIADAPNVDIEDLDAALNRLAEIDAARAEIVEMRYFGGMSLADIAEVLALSESTVKRRWSTARLWLLEALGGDGG